MKKYNKIICPCCNAQYLAQEIFVPSALFGNKGNIVKNNYGLIRAARGVNACMEEEYTCDYCNTRFYIYAKITFKTDIHKDKGFEEEHTISVSDKVEFSEE